MAKTTPMSRLVFARCVGLVARRATQWGHEVLCDPSTLREDVDQSAVDRFCADIEHVLNQIRARR